jgi:hypothetical protein
LFCTLAQEVRKLSHWVARAKEIGRQVEKLAQAPVRRNHASITVNHVDALAHAIEKGRQWVDMHRHFF